MSDAQPLPASPSDTVSPMSKEPVPLTYAVSHWLYFRCLGAIYVCAFLSFCSQILGLIGSEGIVPVTNSLSWVSANLGPQAAIQYPTIFWLNSSDQFLALVPVFGIVAGTLIVLGCFTQFSLLIAGILYLSLVTVGDDFTGFQSDGMLVEVTFLSLFVVSWRQLLAAPWRLGSKRFVDRFCLERHSDSLIKTQWLLWFLIFRIMFGAGAVKILSGDPTWRNLTALSYHYETQPLPTPLAWCVYHMPMWFHQVSVVGTFVIEVMLPFLIFFPGRWRAAMALGTMLLQFTIILTGNYTFLNWLLIVLCIPLLDDSIVSRVLPSKLVDCINERVASKATDSEPERQSVHSVFQRCRAALTNVCVCVLLVHGGCRLVTMLGFASLVPPFVLQSLVYVQSLHIVGAYGMFGVMTTSRPEVVIEGSDDGINWLEYDFKYKPGTPDRAPCFVAPHLPRLDWRLWFAAMETEDRTHWFVPLMKRLLSNDQTVLSLFGKNPFPDHAPKFVRAWVYDYHFTDFAELKKSGCWWRRDNKRVFVASMSLGN